MSKILGQEPIVPTILGTDCILVEVGGSVRRIKANDLNIGGASLSYETIYVESYESDGEVVLKSEYEASKAIENAVSKNESIVIEGVGSPIIGVCYLVGDTKYLKFTGGDGKRHELRFSLGIDGIQVTQRAYEDSDFPIVSDVPDTTIYNDYLP